MYGKPSSMRIALLFWCFRSTAPVERPESSVRMLRLCSALLNGSSPIDLALQLSTRVGQTAAVKGRDR
jgi:hypothetical protein